MNLGTILKDSLETPTDPGSVLFLLTPKVALGNNCLETAVRCVS